MIHCGRDFIKHAYEDEKSHYEMFQQLYYMLTGRFVQNPKKRLPCYNLKDCAKQALLGEFESVGRRFESCAGRASLFDSLSKS